MSIEQGNSQSLYFGAKRRDKWRKVKSFVLKGWGIEDFVFNGDSIRNDIIQNQQFDGDLLDMFVEFDGRPKHKWHHYLPIYDRYFGHWRGRDVKFLEIGVEHGGSLDMWRKYFGPQATIFGIDIDKQCQKLDGISGQVRIGSQSDFAFLDQVVQEMGGEIDIVLDDGSHRMKDINVTLEHLFPQVSRNGIYMVEDLHTAYWRTFGGGYLKKGNFFNYIRSLIDDLHRWYHIYPTKCAAISDICSAIHIHDSICVFEKGPVTRPTHSLVQAPPQSNTQ